MSVQFENELGQGNGVVREWLTELSGYLFGPKSGLFWQYADDTGVVHPVIQLPDATDRCTSNYSLTDYFKLAGCVAGEEALYLSIPHRTLYDHSTNKVCHVWIRFVIV